MQEELHVPRHISQCRHLNEITKEIRGRNGILERLKRVQDQANDTLYSITGVKDLQEKMSREFCILRDYVIKLNYQEKEILDNNLFHGKLYHY